MRTIGTTVVAVVGVEAGHWADVLGTSPNVRRVGVRAADPDGHVGSGRVGSGHSAVIDSVAVWNQVLRSRRRYTVHDADPLAAVADAWVAHYDGVGVAGDLEVARSEVVAAARRGQVELPDYYLVIDADQLPVTRRHWYLGVMAGTRTSRVVPVRSDQRELRRALGSLAPGPWWPELDELLAGVDQVVPDRVGTVAQHPSG